MQPVVVAQLMHDNPASCRPVTSQLMPMLWALCFVLTRAALTSPEKAWPSLPFPCKCPGGSTSVWVLLVCPDQPEQGYLRGLC